MKFLIKERLSPHKYKTPEGYLVCVDSVLARTGKQQYRRSELFGDSCDDADDIVDVDRPLKEALSDETVASFENKPITDEHPDVDVNPGNYKDYAVGFARDIRKSVVDGQDVMIGNLIFTDEDAIRKIEEGECTELSCGYDCDIDDDGNGNYSQTNIRGNHIALCQAGRAGVARIVDSDINDAAIQAGHYYGSKKLKQVFLAIKPSQRGNVWEVAFLDENHRRTYEYVSDTYLKHNYGDHIGTTVAEVNQWEDENIRAKQFDSIKIGHYYGSVHPTSVIRVLKRKSGATFEVESFDANFRKTRKDMIAMDIQMLFEHLGTSETAAKKWLTGVNDSFGDADISDALDKDKLKRIVKAAEDTVGYFDWEDLINIARSRFGVNTTPEEIKRVLEQNGMVNAYFRELFKTIGKSSFDKGYESYRKNAYRNNDSEVEDTDMDDDRYSYIEPGNYYGSVNEKTVLYVIKRIANNFFEVDYVYENGSRSRKKVYGGWLLRNFEYIGPTSNDADKWRKQKLYPKVYGDVKIGHYYASVDHDAVLYVIKRKSLTKFDAYVYNEYFDKTRQEVDGFAIQWEFQKDLGTSEAVAKKWLASKVTDSFRDAVSEQKLAKWLDQHDIDPRYASGMLNAFRKGQGAFNKFLEREGIFGYGYLYDDIKYDNLYAKDSVDDALEDSKKGYYTLNKPWDDRRELERAAKEYGLRIFGVGNKPDTLYGSPESISDFLHDYGKGERFDKAKMIYDSVHDAWEGWAKNGYIKTYDFDRLINAVKQRKRNIHTNLLNKSETAMYTVAVHVDFHGDFDTGKNMWLDIVTEDLNGKQNRVLLKEFHSWEEGKRMFEDFRRTVKDSTMGDSPASDSIANWIIAEVQRKFPKAKVVRKDVKHYEAKNGFPARTSYTVEFDDPAWKLDDGDAWGDYGNFEDNQGKLRKFSKEANAVVNKAKGVDNVGSSTYSRLVFSVPDTVKDSVVDAVKAVKAINGMNDRQDRFLSEEAKRLKADLKLYQKNPHKRPDGTPYNEGTGEKRNINPWNSRVTEAMNDALELIVNGKSMELATARLTQAVKDFEEMRKTVDDKHKSALSKVITRAKKILSILRENA